MVNSLVELGEETADEPEAPDVSSNARRMQLLGLCDVIDQFTLKEEAATWFGLRFVKDAKCSSKEVQEQVLNHPKKLERFLRDHRKSYFSVQKYSRLKKLDAEFLRKFSHIFRLKAEYEFKVEAERMFDFVSRMVCLVKAMADEDRKFAQHFVNLAAKVKMAVKKLTKSSSVEFDTDLCSKVLANTISHRAEEFGKQQREVATCASAAAIKARALLSEIRSQHWANNSTKETNDDYDDDRRISIGLA